MQSELCPLEFSFSLTLFLCVHQELSIFLRTPYVIARLCMQSFSNIAQPVDMSEMGGEEDHRLRE